MFSCNAEFEPVQDVSHVQDVAYLDSWVADVRVVRPLGNVIRKYRAQTDLLGACEDDDFPAFMVSVSYYSAALSRQNNCVSPVRR